ncbi:hypothetical protein QUF75_10750 [Desulfococcaceae bacterium HSG7]|nr:hypothetical protein [Desulfococcaceae bacterium HSG7]
MRTILKILKNQKGQAVTEFFLIFPIFIILMIFLIFIYKFISETMHVQQDVRYALRVTIEKEWQDDFHHVVEKDDVFVKTPQKIEDMTGVPYLNKEIKMSSYAGCYGGLMKSEYRKHYRYRQIE